MPFVIDFWHWWIFGVALLIIEILAPSFFALWMGIAALLVGALLYFVPELSWQAQLIVFAVLAVISIVVWRYYYQKRPLTSDQPALNRRGEQYIGRVVTLQNPIVDGVGRINLDDSTWRVQGADCPAGKRVRIVALNNVIFTVEAAD